MKICFNNMITVVILISLIIASTDLRLSLGQEIREEFIPSQNNFQHNDDEKYVFRNLKSEKFYTFFDDPYKKSYDKDDSIRTKPDLFTNVLRSLMESDLSELNSFLSGVEIKLPDKIYDNFNITCFEEANILTTNFILQEIQLRRIQDRHNPIIIPDIADDKYEYYIRITGLDLVATLDFIADDLSVFDNEGSVMVPVKDCNIDLNIAFKSTDFDLYPPSYAVLDECMAEINVALVQIDGVFLVEQLNTIESLLRGLVEDVIASTVCDLANDAVAALSSALRTLAPLVAPYLDINFGEDDDIPDDLLDDFFANLNERNAIELVDFSNTNTSVGRIISLFVSQVDAFLSDKIEDPDNPYGSSKDLGINTLIRANVLDENQVLKLDQETLLFVASEAPVNTSLTLLRASVKGIDSFTSFIPLQAVSQSLSSSFALPHIKVEMDFRIEMNTGTIIEPESLHIAVQESYTDEITVSVEFTDIFFNSTIFVLLDLNKLENIRIGSFLNTSHLLPCSLASMQDFSLDQFDAALDVNTPIVDRFIDLRIGQLFSNIADAVKFMSDKTLENALPRFLSTTFRENITSMVRSSIADLTAEVCPTFYSKKPNTYLDFRDLLLDADAARDAGGSGDLPYGDVTPFGKRLINENFIAPGDDGSPILNNMIKNATLAQSQKAGTLAISKNIQLCGYDFKEGFFQFGLINVTIENIDTFDYPLDFMAPIGESVLNNQMVIGTKDRPLKFGLRYSTTFNEKKTKNNQYNEFYMQWEFTKLEILFALIAVFYEEEIMQFPLISVANLDCWLSNMPPFEELKKKSFGIDSLKIKYEQLGFSFVCIECSNQDSLPLLMETVHNAGGIDMAIQFIFEFLEDFLDSSTNQELMNKAIRQAPKKCPTHPLYEKQEDTNDNLPGILGMIPLGLIAATTDEPTEESTIELIEKDIPLRSCIPSNSNSFRIPTSKKGHEALIYASLFGAEVGLAMISLMIGNNNSENTNDPLEMQKLIMPQKLETYIDLSNLDKTFLSFLNGPIQQGNASVSNFVNDPTAENGGDLGINNILRGLLDDHGALTVPINLAVNKMDIIANIEIIQARLMGLDSFKKLNLLKFIGPQTIQCEFEIEAIDVEVTISVTTSELQIPQRNITENLTVAIGFNDIKFSAAMFVAIKEEALRSLPLGAMFNSSQLIPCMMRVVDDIKFTQLYLSVAKIKELELNGFLSNDVMNTILRVHENIFKRYENELLQAIPIASQGFVKALANDALKSWTAGECNFYKPKPDAFIDFRDLFLDSERAKGAGGKGTQPYGDVWSILYNLIQAQLIDINEDGYPKINDVLINSLTDDGKIQFEDPILDTEFDLSERFRTEGTFAIRAVYNSSVKNLDSIGNPLLLLYPEAANLLNNSFVIGSSEKPVQASTNAYIKLVDDNGNVLENRFEFSISLTNLGLQALLKAKLKEKSFMEFPFQDIVNINCWISTFPSRDLNEYGVADESEEIYAGIDDIKILLDQSTVEVKCLECESAELQYYAEMFTGASFLYFTQSFITSGIIQNIVDKTMYKAVRKCPHSSLYDPNLSTTEFAPFEAPESGFSSAGTFQTLFAFFTTFVTLTFCAGYSVKHTTKRRYINWLNSLPHEEVVVLYHKHMQEKQENTRLTKITTSMVKCKEIPVVFRLAIPVIVVLNVGLFLSGHLNLGASLDINFFFADQPFKIEKLYTFAILQLVGDMWKWASKAFAALVFICSVVWPYSKQLITLVLWITPPSYISVLTRGKIYRILDFLAKWSMIDIFIIVIALVSFRVKLKSTPNFPDGYFGVDMMMVPLWGLYSNALAQIVSQLSSHVIIYYQDKITEKALLTIRNKGKAMTTMYINGSDEKQTSQTEVRNEVSHINGLVENNLDEKKALCDNYFCLRGDKKGYKVQVRKEANRFVGVIGFATIFCIVYGCFAKYLRIDMTGLIAGVISSGDDGEGAVIKHSVITVAGTVLEVGRFIGTIDKRIETMFLAVLVVATCLFTPLLQCIFVLRLWFVPLTFKERKKLINIVEILMAWQYLEVYFLGTLVMLWQAKPIITGLVRIFCGQLESGFAALSQFGLLDERDARCFLVNASLEVTVIVHIAAAILLDWITKFVMKAVDQLNKDKETRYHNSADDSEISSNSSTNKLDYDMMIEELQKLSILFTDSYSWVATKPIKSKLIGQPDAKFEDSPSSSLTLLDCDF